MKLSVFERLILLNVLSKYEGNIIDLRAVNQLIDTIDFTDQEAKDLEFKFEENGKVYWRKEAELDNSFNISARAQVIVEDRLRDLNKRRKLRTEHLGLYEKFVEKKMDMLLEN